MSWLPEERGRQGPNEAGPDELPGKFPEKIRYAEPH
jgi:hypothetical protein